MVSMINSYKLLEELSEIIRQENLLYLFFALFLPGSLLYIPFTQEIGKLNSSWPGLFIFFLSHFIFFFIIYVFFLDLKKRLMANTLQTAQYTLSVTLPEIEKLMQKDIPEILGNLKSSSFALRILERLRIKSNELLSEGKTLKDKLNRIREDLEKAKITSLKHFDFMMSAAFILSWFMYETYHSFFGSFERFRIIFVILFILMLFIEYFKLVLIRIRLSYSIILVYRFLWPIGRRLIAFGKTRRTEQ